MEEMHRIQITPAKTESINSYIAPGSECHETKQFDYALSLDANKSFYLEST